MTQRTQYIPEDRLYTTWGEIAEALEVSVATAQRWAKQRGMPVKLGPSGRAEIVHKELDAWRKSRTMEWVPRKDRVA